ncbi:amino acid adenylation domain-containing protein [Polyangium sp. 15x6]|uniref:amino acid adenylation domain-containing protein n=1 Tax=Polyangium sp. 15x6 TaxID=3042687 RepID=UPI00249BDA8F|nr:amino acid adenylation domain-containing protein [Polyangium sp. 15x6]MDI3288326.1 amino acid adenylation domain-containing protein [Polyangium sp. 15x6]
MSPETRWDEAWVDLPRGAPLGEILAARARERPDAVALVDGDRVYTYAALDRITNRLAHRLRALGVADEARIGVCLARSSALVIGVVAVVKAGSAYVPLDPSYPDERLGYMLEDAGARLLLGGASGHERLGGARVAFVDLGAEIAALEQLPAGPQDEAPGCVAGGERLAYVVYTSGSTGRPKGVMVTHRGVLRLARHGLFMLGPGDVVAHVSSVSFDAATWEIWGALLNGATLVVFDRDTVLSPELPEQLFAHGVTAMLLTTALFHRFADELPGAFASLKYMLFGGEAADPARALRVLSADPPELLVNAYGPAESTAIAAMHEVRSLAPGATRVPIGHAVRGLRLHVLDGHLGPVPVGTPGELYLGGEGLARGYQGAPGLTASRFLPDPFGAEPGGRMYRTGDIVRVLPDGALEFLGRADDQIKIRGFRVEPGEIEGVLREHTAVVDAAVVVRGEGAMKRLVAYVDVDAKEGADEAALREHVAARLPDYMLPTRIVFLSRLPIGLGGKVDRPALSRGDFD